MIFRRSIVYACVSFVLSALLGLTGCASNDTAGLSELPTATGKAEHSTRYRIAPGDTVQIFVWQNPDLSTSVVVRPDGLLSAPLLEEIPAAGKTAEELARNMEQVLSEYLREPLVTVVVDNTSGTFGDQIRVLGETADPKAVVYIDSMTLLDVLIQTGGLTEFADGNRAKLMRMVDGEQRAYRLRLDDLVRQGDITANVDVQPGDVVIIPEAWF